MQSERSKHGYTKRNWYSANFTWTSDRRKYNQLDSESNHLQTHTCISIYLPSDDVNESAKPYGRVGMLVCVLSKLGSSDEDEDSM